MLHINYELRKLKEGQRDNSTFVMASNLKQIMRAFGMSDIQIISVCREIITGMDREKTNTDDKE